MNEKSVMQNEALRAWEDAGREGGVFLPPGSGKTRLGKMAYEACGKPTTLIVTSRIPLVDQWKEEGLEGVDILCINTACKQPREVELLIVDEVHRSLSTVFRNLYTNVKYKWLLTLSGTEPENEEYKAFLEKISPTVYNKTLSEVLENGGVLSAVSVYGLYCNFDAKSRAKYNVFNAKFLEATMALSNILKKYPMYPSIFDLAKKARFGGFDSQTEYWSKQFWSAMTLRKSAVYDNAEKVKVAKDILAKFSTRKWIIFTKTISLAQTVADQTGSLLYHSKLKKAERTKILEEFSSTDRNLVAVDALNEGLNVPAADAALVLSGVSTVLTNIQQCGRVLRFVEGKKALVVSLITKDTVEDRWVKTKNASLSTAYISSINDIKI